MSISNKVNRMKKNKIKSRKKLSERYGSKKFISRKLKQMRGGAMMELDPELEESYSLENVIANSVTDQGLFSFTYFHEVSDIFKKNEDNKPDVTEFKDPI